MSVAKTAYKFCCSFEGELLVELMLKYWKHPLCEDSDFRNQLLESAAEVLRASIGGRAKCHRALCTSAQVTTTWLRDPTVFPYCRSSRRRSRVHPSLRVPPAL